MSSKASEQKLRIVRTPLRHRPLATCVDRDGFAWVSYERNACLSRFSPDGTEVALALVPARALSLGAHPSGTTFALCFSRRDVWGTRMGTAILVELDADGAELRRSFAMPPARSLFCARDGRVMLGSRNAMLEVINGAPQVVYPYPTDDLVEDPASGVVWCRSYNRVGPAEDCIESWRGGGRVPPREVYLGVREEVVRTFAPLGVRAWVATQKPYRPLSTTLWRVEIAPRNLTTERVLFQQPIDGEVTELRATRDGGAWALLGRGALIRVAPDGRESLRAQINVQPTGATSAQSLRGLVVSEDERALTLLDTQANELVRVTLE